jgi:hypothetical protein
MGDLFTKEFAVEGEAMVRKVPLPEFCKADRVWCSRSKGSQVAIVEVTNNGEK